MRAAIAIVGRPNVGKSTLFNRLVGKKLALVDDRPGVTRDRREGDATLGDLEFRIIDTAGLEEADAGSLTDRMRKQTEAAIADAHLVLFVVDSRTGLTPSDQHFAQIVRKAGKPVVLVANKAESWRADQGTYDAFRLGFGQPIPLSAEHGDGMADLREAIVEALPWIVQDVPDEDEVDDEPLADTSIDVDDVVDPTKPLRFAVVGRPNAGKSTLINRLLGEDRLLTGPEAGITRDAIGIDWEWCGRKLKVFDTAGLRRKARIEDKLEKLAAADGIRAVRFAEVVVLLLDATIPFEKQDLTIADLIEREGRALVIALNKWDLVSAQPGLLAELREEADRLLPQVRGAPLVTVSAETGYGLDRMMEKVLAVAEIWSARVSTARINRWLEGALTAHPPPAVSGRRIKIRYMTQPKTRPPYFAIFGNQLDKLPESYTRYLINSMRDTFDLPGVPIRLSYRAGDNPYKSDKAPDVQRRIDAKRREARKPYPKARRPAKKG